MESDMIMLKCGHNYVMKTWKEGDTCFFCDTILKSPKTNNKQHRAWKGWIQARSSGNLRGRTFKEAQERDRLN